MTDICICIDGVLCTVGQCNKVEGDGEDPGCCKKFFLPITAVVDSVGYDKYSDIWLAYMFGCFYTLFCFKVKRNYSRVERRDVVV
jgi:hypothetical protein